MFAVGGGGIKFAARQRQESGDEQSDRGEASQPSSSDSDQQAAADQDASQADSGQQAAGSDEGVASGGASGADANPDAAELFPVRKIELPHQHPMPLDWR